MSDNYVLALEKDRDTRIAELERCRSEVERFVAEVYRLTRERDEARREWKICQDGMESAQAERDEWKARAEAAEADNARFVRALNIIENDISESRPEDAQREAIAAMEGDHPGAALLGRLRDLEYTVKEMDLDANALWEASARLERLRAAEKVVEAARMLGAYEDFTIDLEPGCDTTPDDPQELNAARHSVHAALAAYDALKEGEGEARLVTTTPSSQGIISLVPEKP